MLPLLLDGGRDQVPHFGGGCLGLADLGVQVVDLPEGLALDLDRVDRAHAVVADVRIDLGTRTANLIDTRREVGRPVQILNRILELDHVDRQPLEKQGQLPNRARDRHAMTISRLMPALALIGEVARHGLGMTRLEVDPGLVQLNDSLV